MKEFIFVFKILTLPILAFFIILTFFVGVMFIPEDYLEIKSLDN